MSEKVSLLRSAGQALKPHWMKALVPAGVSTAVLKPSQSGSLGGTDQGGIFWEGFGQRGQLSTGSSTPSPSLSIGDGVAVGVGVAAEVGVAVDVGAGVGEAVGVGQAPEPMTTQSARDIA